MKEQLQHLHKDIDRMRIIRHVYFYTFSILWLRSTEFCLLFLNLFQLFTVSHRRIAMNYSLSCVRRHPDLFRFRSSHFLNVPLRLS